MTPDFVRSLRPRTGLAVLLALVATPVAAQAPTGKLQGTVRDSVSGDPVADAQVTIPGTAFKASTDSTGYYFINGIPAGRVDVRATCRGYRGIEVRDLRIRSGYTVTQDFRLAARGETIRPVTVSAAESRLPSRQAHLQSQLIAGVYTDQRPPQRRAC